MGLNLAGGVDNSGFHEMHPVVLVNVTGNQNAYAFKFIKSHFEAIVS